MLRQNTGTIYCVLGTWKGHLKGLIQQGSEHSQFLLTSTQHLTDSISKLAQPGPQSVGRVPSQGLMIVVALKRFIKILDLVRLQTPFGHDLTRK